MNLKNKVIFITGSSIGIGRATAFEFAKEGAKLILTYKSSKKAAEKVVKKCRELGSPDVLLLKLDVMDNDSIKKSVEEVKKHFGKIDILVNNAGYLVWKPLIKQTLEEIETCIRTNLEGLIKMTHICLPLVKSLIINIASQVGIVPERDATTYGATKWGVRGFTKALALELPTEIKTYAINPAGTATQMNDFMGTPPEEVGRIIVNLAKGKYNLPSGSDLNIWEYTDL